jgi:hypothetical protein
MLGGDNVRGPEDALKAYVTIHGDEDLQHRGNSPDRNGPDAIVVDLFSGEATALDIQPVEVATYIEAIPYTRGTV